MMVDTLVGRATRVVAVVMLAAAGAVAPFESVAHAATPDAWGFAYLDTATPPSSPCFYVPAPAMQAVSSGLPATACSTGTGTGTYRVTFPGIASNSGVAHVTAVTINDQWCQLAGFGVSGADEYVDVRCYQAGGTLGPAVFTVLYSTSSLGPPAGIGYYGYVRSSPSGVMLASYNNTGSANSVINLPQAGLYMVTLPGMFTGGVPDGNIQVTAENATDPRRCNVAGWNNPQEGEQAITVACFDGQNKPADSGFTLTFQSKRKVYGAVGPPVTAHFGYDWVPQVDMPANFNSSGRFNKITTVSPGQSSMQLPLIGVGRIHVQATAFNNSAAHCTLRPGFTVVEATIFVSATCFTGSGSLVDSDLFLTYTSDS